MDRLTTEWMCLLLLATSCSCGIIEQEIPPDYTRLASGGFYKLHREPLAWEEARSACRAEGAHLLVLESNEEAREVRRWLRRQRLATPTRRSYVLHAGFHEQFVTVMGEPLSQAVLDRWHPKEPSSSICGLVDEEVWMLYGECSEWESFVCEYPAFPSPHNSRAPAPVPARPTISPCAQREAVGYAAAPGWSGSLYKLHSESTWDAANHTCEEEGAHLAVADSEDEIEALIDFLRGKTLTSFEKLVFLGARTKNPVTVLGQPLIISGYNRWLRERQHDWECLAADRRMLFYSRQCSNPNDRYNFLCEKDILP